MALLEFKGGEFKASTGTVQNSIVAIPWNKEWKKEEGGKKEKKRVAGYYGAIVEREKEQVARKKCTLRVIFEIRRNEISISLRIFEFSSLRLIFSKLFTIRKIDIVEDTFLSIRNIRKWRPLIFLGRLQNISNLPLAEELGRRNLRRHCSPI